MYERSRCKYFCLATLPLRRTNNKNSMRLNASVKIYFDAPKRFFALTYLLPLVVLVEVVLVVVGPAKTRGHPYSS